MSHSDSFHPDPDWEALARYRAGECTPQEAAVVREWLLSHPDEAAQVDRLHMLVDQRMSASIPHVTADQVERALARAHRAMDDASPVAPARRRAANLEQLGRRPRIAWWVGGLAAAAAIGTIMVVARPAPHEASGVARHMMASMTAGQAITTAIGARDSVRLPDGTIVLLGPASRVAVSTSYGDVGREVTLDGVARFSVRHDSASPFVVHAGAAVVRDLGTVFTVRGPGTGGGHATSVAVSEGAVSLGSDKASVAPVRLAAGDRGELRSDGEIVAHPGTASDADFAWTRGILDFKDAPMTQVQDELHRWYGVELTVDSALAGRRLTATFERESVDQVLHAIALALGAEVTRDGTVATLHADTPPR